MVKVRLQGPVARYTGYAVGFTGMVKELNRRGEIDFDLRALRNQTPDNADTEIVELIGRGKNHTDIGVLTGFPPYVETLGTKYKIIYTMYETDDIPFDWKAPVEHADEIWVPSVFCARVFGKYNKRIRIVPWGIDNKVFKKIKTPKHDGFTFGALSVMGKRKGIDLLISAFNIAFKGSPDVRLIVKTRDTKWMPEINNPMITVIDEDWPEDRVVQFFNEIDCLVAPSRGEGILMSPLQAAACGTPAITTDWSGPSDYIDNNGIWGIRVAGMSRADNMQAKGALWAEPDIRHIVELMQWAVETKPKVKGDYSKWTIDNMATEFTRCCELAWRRSHGS